MRFRLVKPVLAFGFKSRMMKTAMLAALLGISLLGVAPAQADDIPVVADALAKLKEKPTAEGQWQITAKVLIFSFKQNNKPATHMRATGSMFRSGPFSPSPDALQGTLDMTIDNATPSVNTLRLGLNPNGKVGIQWLIGDTPFLGRPMEYFNGKANGEDGIAVNGIDWYGRRRGMFVTLSSQRVPRKPIGKRYKLTGRMVVTNSDDGYDGFGKDNTCEIAGTLMYLRGANLKGRIENIGQGQPCVTIIAQDAKKGFTLNFDDNIYLDHIFSKPETEYLSIRAFIWDEDKYLDIYPDTMIDGQTRWITLARIGGTGEHTLPGDRDSENIEVYYTVTEVKDLY